MELGSDGSSTVNPSLAAVTLGEHGPDKSRWAEAMGLYAMTLILPLSGHCEHRDCPLPRNEELLHRS